MNGSLCSSQPCEWTQAILTKNKKVELGLWHTSDKPWVIDWKNQCDPKSNTIWKITWKTILLSYQSVAFLWRNTNLWSRIRFIPICQREEMCSHGITLGRQGASLLRWWWHFWPNGMPEVRFGLTWFGFFLKYIEAWSIILDFFDQAFHLQNQLLRLFTDFLSLIFLQSAICYRTPLLDFCIVHSQSSFFYFSYNWIPFSLLKILPARSSSQVHSLLDSTANTGFSEMGLNFSIFECLHRKH